MEDPTKENSDGKSLKVLGGFIVAALDIEDGMSKSVYSDYTDRSMWPAQMTDKSFKSVKAYLSVLIRDTEKHRAMLLSLQKDLNTDGTR